MSNTRKLKQANGGTFTRPRDQWGNGKSRTGERQGAGAATAVWRRARRGGFGQAAREPHPLAIPQGLFTTHKLPLCR